MEKLLQKGFLDQALQQNRMEMSPVETKVCICVTVELKSASSRHLAEFAPQIRTSQIKPTVRRYVSIIKLLVS